MTVAQKHSEIIRNGFIDRLREDDNSITFQEWCLYWTLRARNSDEELTEELLLSLLNDALDDYWLNKSWNECKASKYNKKEITKPWMDVFP